MLAILVVRVNEDVHGFAPPPAKVLEIFSRVFENEMEKK